MVNWDCSNAYRLPLGGFPAGTRSCPANFACPRSGKMCTVFFFCFSLVTVNADQFPFHVSLSTSHRALQGMTYINIRFSIAYKRPAHKLKTNLNESMQIQRFSLILQEKLSQVVQTSASKYSSHDVLYVKCAECLKSHKCLCPWERRGEREAFKTTVLFKHHLVPIYMGKTYKAHFLESIMKQREDLWEKLQVIFLRISIKFLFLFYVYWYKRNYRAVKSICPG